MSFTPTRFFYSVMFHHMWFKFNCFSLFSAKRVNGFLLWAMFISLFAAYWLMYFYLPADDLANQWYTLFISNAFQAVAMSVIVWFYFKGTRNAGIATAWMVHCGIDFISQLLDLHKQIFWFDAFSKLFLLGLAFYVIYDIYQRSKK
jgi:hypothetical protein